MLTHEQKVALYKEGKYRFKCPPVCTAYWDINSWINWIDACNGWTK